MKGGVSIEVLLLFLYSKDFIQCLIVPVSSEVQKGNVSLNLARLLVDQAKSAFVDLLCLLEVADCFVDLTVFDQQVRAECAGFSSLFGVEVVLPEVVDCKFLVLDGLVKVLFLLMDFCQVLVDQCDLDRVLAKFIFSKFPDLSQVSNGILILFLL